MRISASASYLTFMGFLLPVAVDLVGPVEGDDAAGVADVGEDDSQETVASDGLGDEDIIFGDNLLRLGDDGFDFFAGDFEAFLPLLLSLLCVFCPDDLHCCQPSSTGFGKVADYPDEAEVLFSISSSNFLHSSAKGMPNSVARANAC